MRSHCCCCDSKLSSDMFLPICTLNEEFPNLHLPVSFNEPASLFHSDFQEKERPFVSSFMSVED